MISDYDLFVTKFISVPKELGHLNCNAYVAGIVRGVLDGAGFPARYACQPVIRNLKPYLDHAENHCHLASCSAG